MAGHGEKRSRKQEAAIAALLEHNTLREAAQAAGIAFPTLIRWMQLPDFQAAYREARQEALGQAVARMQRESGAATATLVAIMNDPKQSGATRVSAARAILEFGFRGMEDEYLAARITALEEHLGSNKPG